jgi:hypothetical protein
MYATCHFYIYGDTVDFDILGLEITIVPNRPENTCNYMYETRECIHVEA